MRIEDVIMAVEIVTLEKGDILAVTCPPGASEAELAHVRDGLRAVMPAGVRLVVLSGEITLKKIVAGEFGGENTG